MSVYRWKTNLFQVSADVAAAEMQRAEAQYGALTPEALVDVSRDESAPLHDCFEWRDDVAAEKYRCVQAGNMIRSIVVDVEPSGKGQKPKNVRAFVHAGGQYRDIKAVVRTPELYDDLLKQAFAELLAFRQKYSQLTELQGVFDAITKIAI